VLEVTHRNASLFSAIHVPDTADYFHQGKVNDLGTISNLIVEFVLLLYSYHKQLAVSPQPRVPGEAISAIIGSQLAVKVEGIVQVTSSQRYSGRRVRAVQVTIQSNPANPTVGSDGKVYLFDHSIL